MSYFETKMHQRSPDTLEWNRTIYDYIGPTIDGCRLTFDSELGVLPPTAQLRSAQTRLVVSFRFCLRSCTGQAEETRTDRRSQNPPLADANLHIRIGMAVNAIRGTVVQHFDYTNTMNRVGPISQPPSTHSTVPFCGTPNTIRNTAVYVGIRTSTQNCTVIVLFWLYSYCLLFYHICLVNKDTQNLPSSHQQRRPTLHASLSRLFNISFIVVCRCSCHAMPLGVIKIVSKQWPCIAAGVDT